MWSFGNTVPISKTARKCGKFARFGWHLRKCQIRLTEDLGRSTLPKRTTMPARHMKAKSTNSAGPQSASAAAMNNRAVATDATGELAERGAGIRPSAGTVLSRALYSTCYGASYGVTFPAAFLIHAIRGGFPVAARMEVSNGSAHDLANGNGNPPAGNQPVSSKSPDASPADTDVSTKGPPSTPAASVKGKSAAAKKPSKTPLRKPSAAPAKRKSKAPGKPKKTGK